MTIRASKLIVGVLAATAMLVSACGAAATAAPSSGSGGNPPLLVTRGLQLVNDRCSTCHSLDRVKAARETAAEWKRTVDQMIVRGASLTPAEEDAVVQYLAATYK